MVKLFTFVFFTASLFSVILAGTPFDKRTTQDVLYAISRVSHATTELDQLLTMFSSSGSTPGAVVRIVPRDSPGKMSFCVLMALFRKSTTPRFP
jgi:hypothetical protein